MKKLVSVIGASILMLTLLFGLAGCGSDNDSGAEQIVIWAWDPAFNIAALELAAEFFNAENPDVEIIIEEVAFDSIVQQLNIAFAAGTMTGLPNIALVEQYQSQVFLQNFSEHFYPIGNRVNTNNFAGYTVPIHSHNGVMYGVPFDTGAIGMFVRHDILAQAGFSVEDVYMIDWWEALEISEAVFEATGVRMFSQNLAATGGYARMNMTASGTWYTGADGQTVNINNSPSIRRAVEVLKEFVDRDLVMHHGDANTMHANWHTSQVWAVPGAVWLTPSVMLDDGLSGQWTLVPYPRLPDVQGATNFGNMGGSAWYILDVPGYEIAAEFLSFTFGNNLEFHEALLTEIGALSVFTPLANSPVLSEPHPFFGGQPIFQQFSIWANNIPQFNVGLHTYFGNSLISTAIVEILEEGRDIDDALNAAQHHADTQLN